MANSLISRVAISLCLLTLFVSCSKKLDRETAKKAIIEKFQYPYEEIGCFTYGMYKNTKLQNDTIELLTGAGLITMELDGEKTDQMTQVRQMAIPTEKCEDLFRIDNYRMNEEITKQYVSLDSIMFGEVTGILEIDPKKVEVEFSIIRKNVTPFGLYLYDMKMNEILKKKTIFSKYDDGWRIYQ